MTNMNSTVWIILAGTNVMNWATESDNICLAKKKVVIACMTSEGVMQAKTGSSKWCQYLRVIQ